MKQSERDPIEILIADPLDRRFAGFYFSADNSPRDIDNSISINGRVEFGERHQSADGDRRYRIGIRGAFLEVNSAQCNFEPNLKLQDQSQEGFFAETQKTKTHQAIKAGLTAAIKGKVARGDVGISASGSADAGFDRSNGSEKTMKRSYQIYRVRWEAGGCKFGDRTHGDPLESQGPLRGLFLNGDWGRLMPHRGETQYGARFTLLVQKGNLFVERLETSIWDRLTLKPSPEDCAFEALKGEVSAWYVEQQLTGQADGFDKERAELVLAQGAVSVNLGAFDPPEVEGKPDDLVEGQTTLALPPPAIATSAQTAGKRKRAQKPVQKNG
jgi:hypothetical protein